MSTRLVYPKIGETWIWARGAEWTVTDDNGVEVFVVNNTTKIGRWIGSPHVASKWRKKDA